MHTSWLVLLLTLATVTRSEHYHIVPVDSTDSCHDYQNGTCFTLEQLVQTDLLSGGDKLTLSFLSGDHLLSEMLYICNFREVIIAGQNATINANKTGRAVYLSNISALSIEGLNFTGAGDKKSSGYISQELFIAECSLVDLKLLKLESCTLWITHVVTVRIEQVLFVNNTSTDKVLHVKADTVCIEKSDFFSNSGGAVNIYSKQTVINDSRFDSNTGTTYGGAVEVDSVSVTISWCNFTNNSAYYSGGAISTYYSGGGISAVNVSISFCNFMDNIAQYGGGAISTFRTNLFISNCALLNNSAIRDGGAINIWFGSVSISDSELAYNSAERSGGAILVLTGKLLIYDSKLTNNKAPSGGVIALLSVNASIMSCNIMDNEASGGSSTSTSIGAILVYTGTIYPFPKSCLKIIVLILVECFLLLMAL